jgi:hypothetical protein
MTMLNKATERFDDELEAVKRTIAELDRRLDIEASRLEARDTDVATEGIRLEALGLGLAVIGVVLQTVAESVRI